MNRQFLKQAKQLGFVPDGHDSRGHQRLVNAAGRCVSVSHTPSDIRWQKNALAKLRRIARG